MARTLVGQFLNLNARPPLRSDRLNLKFSALGQRPVNHRRGGGGVAFPCERLAEGAAEPAAKSREQGLRIDDDFCVTYGSW